MNSDNYKKAFSNIRPSDKRLERIFDMTEKKKRARGFKKGLIVVIAVMSVLMCGALTANAATDGALFEGVKLVINGEEANISDYLKNHNSYKNDDGDVVDQYTFDLPDDAGSISYEMVGGAADNTASIEIQTDETTTEK
ncbi:MAG: hypothetical protein NC213_04680 [Acetobacter sp.]|nr:hypothetical protein [Bacteroides sp.]MCM1341021.1 hypothetical protein [Acetobacter sp.]MCM1432423.1 hypothetical protein [Clostridiales bacterium]